MKTTLENVDVFEVVSIPKDTYPEVENWVKENVMYTYRDIDNLGEHLYSVDILEDDSIIDDPEVIIPDFMLKFVKKLGNEVIYFRFEHY